VKMIRRAILVLLLLTMSAPAHAGEPEYDPFYTKGVSLDGGPPINGIIENIDPFSGNLKIVQTDLELPQNGGLDLKLMRFYDSAIWSRWSATAGVVALNRKSPLGIGWYMHMGIMRNPFGNGGSIGNPVFEMPDGSRHTFYLDKNDVNRMISEDYWVYKRISTSASAPFIFEMTAPDGTVYTLETGGVNAGYYEFNSAAPVAQVTKIQNASRTSTITMTYQIVNDPYLTPYSYLKTIVDTVGRVITFNYNQSTHQLNSILVDNRTYSYYYNTFVSTSGWRYNTLVEVKPPVGNSWRYTYETGNYGMIKLTYPTGGEINYVYAPVNFPTGGTFVYFRVISQRSTSGRDIPSGTWTYQYAPGGNSGIGTGAVTTVLAPNEMKEVYRYYSWDNCGSGFVWRVGRPMTRELYQNNSLIEKETYTWGQGTQISFNHINSADWGGIVKSDSSVYLPLNTSTLITRSGQNFSTTYSNHDTYGNPRTISEVGNKTRTTNLTYWSYAAKNIVKGKPLSETVTGGFPGSFTTTYVYFDSVTGPQKIGLLKQVSKYGVVTNYDYSTNGNLLKITDANSKVWTYSWSNGKISTIAKPVYTISRVINANGTIASETDGRGQKTSYLYDGNLRLTKVTPPLGNPINFEYPLDNAYRKEIRGSYYLFAYFDGFGRSSGTLDSKGVTTDIDYKAYGSKNFTDSNIGDRVVYDAFERVDLITHKDNTTIDYSYSGSNVTVTDEATKTTLMTYNAFGDPDEKLLVSVKDSLNNTASYGYNILGSLTTISFGGVSRTFAYNTKNFLTSEVNPETGTLTYGRDNVGNLTSIADATGTTTYVYDAINRLVSVSKSGSSISFVYDNADNRTSAISPSANQTYIYDAANRLTKKSETILGVLYSTQFTYDANDNLTGITYPSGLRTLSYQYNGNNEITAVPGYVTNASYNLAGLPLTYSYSNGIINTFSYNNRFLPTGISSGSVLKRTFGYDSRGNTTSIIDGYNAGSNQTLSYDVLNRLTGFNGSWGTGSFTYSVDGNRLTKTVAGVGTTYGYYSNRLVSASGGEPGSFGYDGVGRVTSGTWGGKSYNLTYDNFNNVATFLSGANVLASNGYDGDGLRVTKTADGRTIVYHLDHHGNILSENYTNGKWIADYIYLNGKLLAKVTVEMDYDSDGVPDIQDAFPNNPAAWLDADGNAISINDTSDVSENHSLDYMEPIINYLLSN